MYVYVYVYNEKKNSSWTLSSVVVVHCTMKNEILAGIVESSGRAL